MIRKTDGLLFNFAVIFFNFTVFSILISGIMTYVNQTQSYKNQRLESIRQLDAYIECMMQEQGLNFKMYSEYFAEHRNDIHVPPDFTESGSAYAAFYTMFAERYPGKTFGVDIPLDEIDDDVKNAWAVYTHEYWLLTLETARDSFGLSYVYFFVPDEETHDIYYLFDGMRFEAEDENGNGLGYLLLGDVVHHDPEDHQEEWEIWRKGVPLENVYEEWDNQYGHTYAYYYPLIIDGQKIGLIGAEVDVLTVNNELVYTTLVLMAGVAVVLAVMMFIMLLIINRRYISKIVKLNKAVTLFTADKDYTLAEKIDDVIVADAEHFSELSLLAKNTAEMVREIERHIGELTSMTAEKERLGAELNVATKIQADMLPTLFPVRSDFQIWASMTPAKEVGGDFYDFFMIDDDHLGLVMADVSGKGVPAALFMVIAKTLIKNRALMHGTPANILSTVNNQLCENNNQGLFVTVWLGILDLETGILICSSAGHEYPSIKHRSGAYELVTSENYPPLATMEDMEYSNEEHRLKPGDSLFLYTDGIPEAKSKSGERFGINRMLGSLNMDDEMPPEDMLVSLKKRIDEFTGGSDPFDDITMLCVKYTGRDGNSAPRKK